MKQLSYSKSSLLMSVAMIFAILPIFQLGFLPAFLFSEEYFYTIPISNIFGDLFSFGCPIIYAFTVYVYMRTAPNAPLWCTGELAETLGKVQPFRYRGYVFDEETGLYYLRSRYYNAERCRFLNADIDMGKE